MCKMKRISIDIYRCSLDRRTFAHLPRVGVVKPEEAIVTVTLILQTLIVRHFAITRTACISICVGILVVRHCTQRALFLCCDRVIILRHAVRHLAPGEFCVQKWKCARCGGSAGCVLSLLIVRAPEWHLISFGATTYQATIS